ncbi:methyl-accepting chemotaxis protein [Salinispira pacifica]|uniref:Methyl-accepting chemotaxis protein n=1 Tax=Salinispira pacifica TaxID=1307761 RepID=V5WKT9_9SPIO|nr:HAMP domain-containing methyl-accepting chemotaxis protein [Salinispira pacifica]AHC16442.1 methyl-accepting chemotaxis protein [Salinispira pacifica]
MVIILSILIVRSILKLIRLLEAGVRRAGNLDLTVSFPESRDELGQLGRQLNVLFAKLHGIVGELKRFSAGSLESDGTLNESVQSMTGLLNTNREHMHNLEFSASNLGEQVQQVQEQTQAIEHSVESINRFMEEQSASADESSAAIEEMEASLRRIAEIISARHGELLELVESTRSSQEQGKLSTETISSVAEDIDGLNEILTVITGVASQTSLLSMNAAIESAHAGDAGRGFAVVAEEIRKLAETTTQRSKEIRENLKNIIGKIQGAEEASLKNFEYLEQSAQRLVHFAQSMEEIQQSTSEVSTGSRQVLTAANELSNSVNSSRESSRSIQKSIGEIGRNIGTVQEFSSRLNGRVGDMLDHSGKILEQVNQVENIQQHNSKQIRSLGSMVDDFTT